MASLSGCWGLTAPTIAAWPLATARGRCGASIACPTAPAGGRGTLLQEMLQETKMARLTTEAAILRSFIVAPLGIVCPKRRLSGLSLRGRHLLLIKTRAFLRGNAANGVTPRGKSGLAPRISADTRCAIYRVPDTTKGSNP